MTSPAPFAYAAAPHERLHHPLGYETPEKFKGWLRDEFAFRCAYCLERERWYPDGAASFSVEHIVARAVAPSLLCEYTNLVYACTRCNSAKRDQPLLDPTAVAMAEHLRLGADGLLIGLTDPGRDLIEYLRLNEGHPLSVRRKFLTLLALHEGQPENALVAGLFNDAFAYPDDMPDLRILRPPGGNAKPGSEDQCHFARRERGELPAVY